MRCSATAMERGDADLDDQIDRADVDAQFERGRRDHGSQLAALEPLLGFEAQLARQAAVMRQHAAFAEALGEAMGHALAHAARRTKTSVVRLAAISSATRS